MKQEKIFRIIIAIEIVATSITLFTNYCTCTFHTLLNPLGLSIGKTLEGCLSACMPPHPSFFILADLLILTILAYIIFRIFKRNKQKT